MKLFVTGATGFIGGALARRAVAAGHEVTALVRDPSRAGQLRALGVRVVRGDVTKAQALPDAMDDHDAVFHFAAWYEIGIPRREHDRMYEINVTGTVNVLTAAKKADVARVLHCSSAPAWFGKTDGQVANESFTRHSPPVSVYERTKIIAHERAAEAARSGLPVTILLPTAVYGPDDPNITGLLLRLYRSGWLKAFPAPDAGFSWVHVDDVAAGAMAALERGRAGESYILGGDNLTFRELFAVLERAWGIPAPRFLPATPLRALRPLGRLPFSVGPVRFGLIDEGLSSLGVYFFSSDKASRELGCDPRPAEVGLRETLASMERAANAAARGRR